MNTQYPRQNTKGEAWSLFIACILLASVFVMVCWSDEPKPRPEDECIRLLLERL